MAEFIWSQIEACGQAEAAFIEAMGEFNLGRRRVLAIWSVWRPILERIKRRKLRR